MIQGDIRKQIDLQAAAVSIRLGPSAEGKKTEEKRDESIWTFREKRHRKIYPCSVVGKIYAFGCYYAVLHGVEGDGAVHCAAVEVEVAYVACKSFCHSTLSA